MLATSSPSSPPREVRLGLGGSVQDPTDPVGRLLFNVLAVVAEFESEKVAHAKGRLRGKKPKLSPRQECHLVALRHARTHTSAELAALWHLRRRGSRLFAPGMVCRWLAE